MDDPSDLQLQNHLHAVVTQRADVVQDQGRDDVDAVGLVGHDARLENTTNSSESNSTDIIH